MDGVVALVGSDSIDATFSKRGWLSVQPADFRQAVVKNGRLLRFEAGQPIFLEGDEGGGIYGILSGTIGCEVTSRLSGPTLVHIMQPGWWFGEGPMLFHRRRTLSFVTIEPAALLLVALQAIRGLETEGASTTRRFGQIAELAAMLAIEAGSELLIRDARQRLAAVLLRITAVLEGVIPANAQGFRITQSQVAEMSNMSRHHANVALLELQAGGYIALGYGRIAVLDPKRLAQFAGAESVHHSSAR